MVHLAILVGVSLLTSSAQTPAREWEEEERLETRQGAVAVEKSDDDDHWRVTFGGRVLAETEYDKLALTELFEGGDGRDYVVFRRASGGIACPYQFRVIELAAGAQVVLSEEFGSCLEPKRTRLLGDAIVFDMDMHIPHPDLLTPAEIRRNRQTTEIYTVRRGKVTKRFETRK